jgi:predicted DNA-binding transcriptional regulator AlpA
VKGHGEKLGRKQEQAIAALLTAPTIGQAAQAVGISEPTLWRWLKRPDFQRAYRRARQEVVAQAVSRVQQLASQAVEALASIMEDAQAPAGARVSAAKAILELSTKSCTLDDLREQLAELEARLPRDGTPHARIRAAH